MFKTILVPTDGSPLAEKAIPTAVQIAKEAGGKVVGISVAHRYPRIRIEESTSLMDYGKRYEEDMLKHAQEHVQKVADVAAAAGVPCEVVTPISSDPYRAIIDAAQNYGCDVIVMASHGRGSLTTLFVGSETQKVLAHSSIPVLVVR